MNGHQTFSVQPGPPFHPLFLRRKSWHNQAFDGDNQSKAKYLAMFGQSPSNSKYSQVSPPRSLDFSMAQPADEDQSAGQSFNC
jgi:hypothetical protein